jgi:8-oxo-dGTP pyrophosphatase MutT (NUDIX family)
MDLLTVILRDPGMSTQGKTIQREAVRGIIIDGCKLLMIHTPGNGAYKFPGGGVAGGETHGQALAREILEECGARVAAILRPFGKVIEFWIPVESEFDVLRMTSYYYLCQVEPALAELRLDPYELDLGFHPLWVELDQAIRCNQQAVDLGRWNARETFVLERVRERLIGLHSGDTIT